MSWSKRKLGELCEITSSKRIFYSEYVERGVPFYRSKEIIESSQGMEISEPLFISEEKYAEIKNKFGVPTAGDMLLTSVGTIGVPYIVKESDRFYFKDGNLTWFRNYSTDIIPEYIYFWVRSTEGQGVLNNTTIGSSQKALTISSLNKIEIAVPPVNSQKAIVKMLSAYDNLIENNQKQIKLLEEAVQRLYKEWFVDLRFPGYEDAVIVDGVPEGWRKTALEDIVKLRKETVTKGKIPDGIPYIGLEHMPRKDICLSTWGNSADVNSNKSKYYENDIIFGKIRPYFHKVGFALNNGVTSTDTFVMNAQDRLWGLLLSVVSSTDFVNYSYQNCKEGAKMPRADWKQMKNYQILIASNSIQQSFEKQIWTITRNIKCLALQNRKLVEARDRLLPKLMSGEIEV